MGLATMENLETVIGSFVEKDFGKTHEYSLIGDDMFGLCLHWAAAHLFDWAKKT